jgi:hypothetical protein
MYCETQEELAVFDVLKASYPQQNEYLLDLMSWVFVNNPQQFEKIMHAHRETCHDELVDLSETNIKSLLRPVQAENQGSPNPSYVEQ